jgi:metallo-beta-lactamase class B
MRTSKLAVWALSASAFGLLFAQTAKITTPQDLFKRNVGTKEDQDTAFPPHKIAGNLYYVGTRSLGTFLLTTPQGHILINTSYERTVPVIRTSVEKLGFKFTDIKIILGSHAHGDHMEGDAMAKELSGAQVMALEQDVPALQKMMPGGKPHPIDRVLKDGEQVKLGGMTLTAHLTPGHTKGCTTWEFPVEDGGKKYNVVIIGSVGVNPGMKLVGNADYPNIADDFKKAFLVLRGLKADIPLGSHPGMYNLSEKYPKLGKGPNPFIDPAGYKEELDIVEGVFRGALAEQTQAAK